MKLPYNLSLQSLSYHHQNTHEFSDLPYGWGTMYSWFDSTHNTIEGLVDINNIPSNNDFWKNEVESCKAVLELAIQAGNTKEIEAAFESYHTATLRLEKEHE